MKFKKLRTIYIATLMVLSFTAYSQSDSTKTFTFSGSVDTYVHTSLGSTNDAYGTHGPSTAFANLKGFSLGMVNLIASYQGEKAGFIADVVFGPRGRDAVFYDEPREGSYTGQRIINQLLVYYKLSDGVTLNMGQFNTFVGYEVISPAINVNYSTSYLFSNGPFNQTGLRADFSFGDGGVAKLAIMNPTDMLEFNPVNTYTLGAQIGKTSDAGGVWLNLLYGDQDGTLDEDDFDGDIVSSAGTLFQADVTTGWTLSDAFFLGANVSYQTISAGEAFNNNGGIDDLDTDATSFFGVALYPKLTLSETFALGLRGEYFSSKKGHPLASPIGVDAGGDGNVIAATLSGNYKVGGLIIIPEVRFDKTSEDSFTDKDGDAKDVLTTLTLAAVYKF
jgi:hypothetical protein